MNNKILLENLKPSIGNPAKNALAEIGITTLQQLTKLTEKELLKIHGVGPKAVGIIKDVMKKEGITFKKED